MSPHRCIGARCLALVVLAAVVLVQCSTHMVSRSEPTLVRSRSIDEEMRLDVLSEPTAESPMAMFLSVRLVRVEETHRETTVVRKEPRGWAVNLLGFGGGLTALASGGLAQTYPVYGTLLGCAGLAGVGFAILSGCGNGLGRLRTTVNCTVDTSLVRRPIPVEVVEGERIVATLVPDDSGIAEFPVREYLQSLRDTLHDVTLTARTTRPDSLSRTFFLPRVAITQACEELRAERVRQAREERGRREAKAQAEEVLREQKRRATEALDNAVASLDDGDRVQLKLKFMYADVGFQYLVATGNLAKALGISTYGEFLELPLHSQIWALREVAGMGGGERYAASVLLQEVLHIPAYLAEKILR